MRFLACALIALIVSGCASTRPANLPRPELSGAAPSGWAPTSASQIDRPPMMNPATPGPSANAAYDWCLRKANQETKSPAWTTYGSAYVNGFLRSCMVELGADPAYTAVLLQQR